MSARDDGMWLGLLLVGAVLMLRRRVDWGDVTQWVWPVPDITVEGVRYPAVISDGVGSPRSTSSGVHQGVDVCFKRRARGELPTYAPGTAAGTPGYFAPKGVPVVAARAGKVWSVAKTPRGWAVVLSHGAPWATFYQHMETTLLPPHANGLNVATGKPTPVKAGDVLGLMGGDPMQGATAFRHLHFEVWHGGDARAAVDPADAMRSWPRVPWAWGVS